MPTRGTEKKNRTLYFVAMFGIVVLASVAVVYGVSNWAAEAKARKMPNPVAKTEENFEAGKKTYTEHCVQCHGDKGDGKGQKSAELSVEPGDFTDPRKMHDLTDGDLYWQISEGRKPMPGFADKLNPTQEWQAVNYIRGFLNPPNAAAQQATAPQQKP